MIEAVSENLKLSRTIVMYDISMAIATMPPPTDSDTPPVKKNNGHGGKRPGAGQPPKVDKEAAAERKGQDETFWEWLDSLPKDSWNHLICYLHRTEPLIDLTGGGKPTAIEKIVHPFDMTYIYQTHGSGCYRFDISEIPADGSRQRRIRQSFVSLRDPRFPPNIPMGRWLDDSRNIEWEWARPQIEAVEAERKRKAADASVPAHADPMEQLTKTMEFAERIKGKSEENPSLTAALIKALTENSDPGKQIEALKTLKDLTAPPEQKKDDSAMTLLITMLMEDRKAAREEMRELRNAPQSDPLASSMGIIKQVTELLGGFGLNLGGGGGKQDTGSVIASSIRDVAVEVVGKLSDNIPSIIQTIQFVKEREFQIKQMEARKEWQFPAGQQQPAQEPAPVTPTVVTPPPAPSGPMNAQLLLAKYQNVLMRSMPFLIDHFQKGASGRDFQDWLIEDAGMNTWNQFRKDATPELLIGAVGSVPQLAQVFQPAERVKEFFTDLLTDWPEEEEEDADDDETQPV
jgi:hypothetical protein